MNEASSGTELGCEVHFFKEKDIVVALIRKACSPSETIFNEAHEKLSKILLAYLEQPQLVLPHVTALVGPINEYLYKVLENLNSCETSRVRIAYQ